MKDPKLCFSAVTRFLLLLGALCGTLNNGSTANAACASVPPGAVAWWPLDNNGMDLIGGHVGTVSGNVTFSNAAVGVGLNLSTVPAGLVVSNAPDLNFTAGADFSIEAWIQPQIASTAFDVMAIVDKRVVAGSANALGYAMYLNDGRIGLQLSDNINNPVLQGGWIGPDLRDGSWHHVAATVQRYSSTGGKLYVDGSMVAVFDPTSKAGSLENEAPLLIGSHPSYPDFDANFRGGIDELSIYSRALTDAEVTMIFQAGSAGKCIGPTAPVVFQQPKDQTAEAGSNLSFSALASGTAPLSYRWLFNETNVLAETSATLVLTNIGLSQAGTYALLVSNRYGTALSSNAILTLVPAPSCAVPPMGLVAWWKGEQGAQEELGINNGTLQNGVGFAPGEAGQAFSFNGVNSFVQVTNSPSLNPGTQLTVEFWMKADSDNAMNTIQGMVATDFYVVGIFPGLEWHSYGVNFGISTDSGASFVHVSDANGGGARVTAGQWHHIAGTYDGSKVQLYVDGQLWGNPAPVTGVISPMQNFLSLGSEDGRLTCPTCVGTRYYKGLIDEVSIYGRALTLEEVQSIYSARSSGKCIGPSAPVVFQQPTNQNAEAGSNLSFSALASGTAPLSYQWLFNETNVLAETSPTLVLTNIGFSQAGSYVLQVSNAYGSIRTSNAILTVIPAPPCAVPPMGLVAWWKGEQGGQDELGANNGTLVGNANFGPAKVGQGFILNTNAYVQIPASQNLDVGAGIGLTIEAWIKPDDTSSQQAIAEYNDGNGNLGVQLWFSLPALGGPGSLFANLVDLTGANHYFASIPNIVTTEYQHVALTYDKATGAAALYLNGVVVAEQNLGIFTLRTTYPLTLGARTSGPGQGSYFNGVMDEVSVYGRGLTPEEVQAIYAARSSGKCTGPTAPVVFQQPKDKTVEAGSDVIISALASGTAPLSYRWLFNETNVLETSFSMLNLTNVQLSQAGTYALQASNAYGTALSSNAILTVTPPPPCVTPAADLVSWWRGEAGAWDELGGNSGVLSNDVSFGRGKVGQAFVFDGNGDAILLGNPANLQLQSLTLEGWIKRASATKASQGSPGSGYLFAFGPGGYGLMMESGGWLDFGRVGGQMLLTSARITDTNYHHVAVTKSGTAVAVYLDGIRRTSLSYSYSFAFTNPAAIGARPDGLNGFWGNIDEFSMYKRALTAAEITSIFTAGVSGKCITPTAPVVLAGLVGRTATVGDTVSLGVSVGGTPPFSYQWTYQGNAIAGEIGPSLLLTNVQMSQAGLYSVVVTNSIGATNSSSQLAVNFAPAVVRVVDTTAQAGRSVAVPITILANGNENAIGFSLNFNPSQLTYESVTLGSGIFGGMLFFNSNAVANGKLGVAVTLPPGVTLTAGLQELALVTFRTAILTNSVASNIGFSDSPVGRQLSDAPGNSLSANYAAGNVAITAAELEGDVSPRPGGDHNVTITDWVLVGRYVALLDSPTNSMEFQHADCAPQSTLGDGVLSLTDWVQAGRYAARLDELTLTGGPIGASSKGGGVVAYGPGTGGDGENPRQIKIADAEIVPGLQGNVAVQLISQGDENAIGFSLLFDPAVVTYVSASPGADAPAASLTINASEATAGRLAVLLALPPGASFVAGTKEAVRLAFKLSASASGTSTVSLTDQPVKREVADAFASSLPADYIGGKITVGALPVLTIAHAGGILTLAWPGWGTNFVVQEAMSLEGSSLKWTNVLASPVLSNGQNLLQVPVQDNMRFFRLQLAQ